ncbi:hypothetical protein BJX99DRAFT_105213 [Aspergillus californicus]
MRCFPIPKLGVMEQRDRDLSATQQGSKTSQESSVFSGKVSLNQDIAFAAGIDEPLPERLETLTLFTWNWVPRDAQDSKAEKIALHLISESEGYFHCVEFKDWVQEATDFSGAVRFLESKYDGLSAMLYYYLRRHAEEYWKYLDVKKVLEKEADPFLFQAVEHACNCFMRRKWVEYSINFQFITDPLKRVLSRSSPIQDMKLDALAVRFRRWYSNSPERVWLQEFDTRTDFLDQLYHMKPEALAIQLSEADLCLFQGLTVDNLMKGSSDVLSALNTRWNNLSCESEECSTAGFDSKLIELIKELYRLSNFYSLTAILLGIHSRGRRLSALEEFNYLIDLNGNYLLYRQCVPPGPALHFLLPFIRIRVGNAAAASMSSAVCVSPMSAVRSNFLLPLSSSSMTGNGKSLNNRIKQVLLICGSIYPMPFLLLSRPASKSRRMARP